MISTADKASQVFAQEKRQAILNSVFVKLYTYGPGGDRIPLKLDAGSVEEIDGRLQIRFLGQDTWRPVQYPSFAVVWDECPIMMFVDPGVQYDDDDDTESE